MHRKIGMGVEEYLEYCKENRSVARFKGLEPFQELLDSGRITPFVTTIRVMYSGVVDQCYQLNDNVLFQSLNDPDRKPQNPEEVLSEVKNPDGWEIEGLKPKHLTVKSETCHIQKTD